MSREYYKSSSDQKIPTTSVTNTSPVANCPARVAKRQKCASIFPARERCEASEVGLETFLPLDILILLRQLMR